MDSAPGDILREDAKSCPCTVMPLADLMRVHGVIKADVVRTLYKDIDAFARIPREELDTILAAHEKFVMTRGKEGRVADFRSKDLSGIDFSGKPLAHASFRTSDISQCDFTGADLRHADFYGACYDQAVFAGADLSNANFSDASVTAEFSGADLTDATFLRAVLTRSHFGDATLCNTDFSDATVAGTDIGPAIPMACPETGSYICYKAALRPRSGPILSMVERLFRSFIMADAVIVEMEVPETAYRSSATSNRCRCSEARVISITNISKTRSYNRAISIYDTSFEYIVGETVRVENFDMDRWHDYGPGIYHFMDRRNAEIYAGSRR